MKLNVFWYDRLSNTNETYFREELTWKGFRNINSQWSKTEPQVYKSSRTASSVLIHFIKLTGYEWEEKKTFYIVSLKRSFQMSTPYNPCEIEFLNYCSRAATSVGLSSPLYLDHTSWLICPSFYEQQNFANILNRPVFASYFLIV